MTLSQLICVNTYNIVILLYAILRDHVLLVIILQSAHYTFSIMRKSYIFRALQMTNNNANIWVNPYTNSMQNIMVFYTLVQRVVT